MYDNIWELLETCLDLIKVCQKLIITERNSNREEIRQLEAKLAGYTANKTLAEVLKK